MKNVIQFRDLWLFFLLSTIMIACQKEKPEQIISEGDMLSEEENVILPQESENVANRGSAHGNLIDCNTFYGPMVKMGKGHIRSWINIHKRSCKPKAIGIEFTSKSFSNLPTDPENFAANTFVLKLHHKAKEFTPFDHITVNWEPAGHEPAGIYNVPHFDIHFYKITLAAQMAISPVPGPVPPAGYLPPSYVIQGATVPQMGTHWLNPASPELPPTSAPFTHTFIYGSSNGKVIFVEPMITRAFMLSGNPVFKPYPQPTLFSPSGTNYPTVYRIWKNSGNGRHYVALTDFVSR